MNVFRFLWKCEYLKGLGIGSDDSQRVINHNQARSCRNSRHSVFPFSGDGFMAASDELTWPYSARRGPLLRSRTISTQRMARRVILRLLLVLIDKLLPNDVYVGEILSPGVGKFVRTSTLGLGICGCILPQNNRLSSLNRQLYVTLEELSRRFTTAGLVQMGYKQGADSITVTFCSRPTIGKDCKPLR